MVLETNGASMRVFISSTYRELAEVRSRLIHVVRQAGQAINGMEEFGARHD